MTDDLVTWLRQQLDRDEQHANDLDELAGYERNGIESTAGGQVLDYLDRFSPARVLSEVDAKRRILDRLAEDAAFDMPATKAQAASHDEWYLITTARDVIKALALPYADRPGYRDEWRP